MLAVIRAKPDDFFLFVPPRCRAVVVSVRKAITEGLVGSRAWGRVGCQNSVRVPEKCGFAGGTRFLAPHTIRNDDRLSADFSLHWTGWSGSRGAGS